MGMRLGGSLGPVCWARGFGLDPGAVGWCCRCLGRCFCSGWAPAGGSEGRAGQGSATVRTGLQTGVCRRLGGSLFSYFKFLSFPACAVSSRGVDQSVVAGVFWKERWVTRTLCPPRCGSLVPYFQAAYSWTGWGCFCRRTTYLSCRNLAAGRMSGLCCTPIRGSSFPEGPAPDF